MKRSDVPFNITLLEFTPAKTAALKPVRSQDIFDGATGNFHEDGLFSSSIFGKTGTPDRMKRFSFIDVKVPIFHPIIYRALLALKRLYGGIIDGTEYVLWNDEINDFERADAMSGKTGFAYFVKHWKNIAFEESSSVAREQNILLINKYKDTAMTSKIAVLPAGLRDVEVGDDGRVREDEINGLYRNLLSISNTISESSITNNPDVIDTARLALQKKFIEVYELLENMIEGKKKLLMGKWASRAIMNGTRNVITAMDTSVSYLGAPGTVTFNNTIVGLYQGMKAILPVSQYLLKNGFLSKVFLGPDVPAVLVDKKTLKRKDVQLKPQYFERWMTDEGLEKIITSFSQEGLRDKEIEIEGHYLGLIYKGPDGTFKIIQDIDSLPETRNKEHVTPLTFAELAYLSGYNKWNNYPIFVTRYPVAGMGSIYPSKMYMKTTIKSEIRRELDDMWVPLGDEHVAYEFPTKQPYVNSLVPHSAKLAGLVADFDGDMVSGNATYTDESIQEIDSYLHSWRAYVGTNGNFMASVGVDTVELVFHNLTGD